MAAKHTLEELNNCSREELVTMILMMQGQLDAIDGQLSFFDEAESCCDLSAPEPAEEEVIPSRRRKKKGQRETDLKDFPVDIIPPYRVSKEELDNFYGAGNWRRLEDETYKRLRHEPESWTVEVHTVEVYLGTDGEHQDEFLRGKRPKYLLRGSIVTPSLLASILNVKYVNSSTLHRIEQEFKRNGVNISRQTMSNWIIRCSEKYFVPFVERMKQELLSLPVTQSDETPTQVIGDSDHPNSKCYMWVHRSGEFYKDRPVVVYEYQKGRDHEKPLDFYRDYKGILVTDSLEQYHLLDRKLPDVTNANCWAHARRAFADVVKAADKKDPQAVKSSVAYRALQKIAEFYSIDTGLKELPKEERLKQRQEKIQPLVEELFAWVKQQVSECAVPPKSKTGQGLNFIINQEKFHNTARGAEASALVYSISEAAKLNNLRPYYYFRHILTELPKLCDKKGNIDPAKLDILMPWSTELPEECRKPRHS